MPRISSEENNVFAIPTGAVIDKRGYVYVNTSTEYGVKKNGTGKYSTHKKKCVGKACISESGKRATLMFANRAYFELYKRESLPSPPERADTISVGLKAAVSSVDSEHGLSRMLTASFGTDNAMLVMDLASYMLSEESAIFQHFPKWARSHALFSPDAVSDSTISLFLRKELTVSKIEDFKQKWARANIGSGHVYFCYDSTNTNSQAQGVFLVEKGHAKDDPSLSQVNTDYVVRQEDGMPLTFKEFPGSINDMAEASEMVNFLKKLTENNEVKIVLVCDRGYISRENVEVLDASGIGFLMLLRSNLKDSRKMIRSCGSAIKEHEECYLPEHDIYGASFQGKLFDEDHRRFFHVFWDQNIAGSEQKTLRTKKAQQEKELRRYVERKTRFVKSELDRFYWFDLKLEEAGEKLPYKGRGRRSRPVATDSYVIQSFSTKYEVFNEDLKQCGFFVLVSSNDMTAAEAYREYRKRDCVEKVFRALKSSLGMDRIGTHSDDAIVGKSLVWFVASILRSAIFLKLEKLRELDRKNFTVPASLDQLDSITAYKDLNTGEYSRRYSLNAKQKKISNAIGFGIEAIDRAVEEL